MGSSKGGGGGHTPVEKPNTLESAQRLKIIDLLCEGVASQDVSFKNIYLDNTPIQNDDDTYNFTGIRVAALPGTHNQDYLAGFDSTDKIVAVGAEVKAATSITRTITDPLVDSVRVTLALGSLVTMKDNGDRVGGDVSLTVMCGNKSYPVTISGKTTSAYHQDVLITDLPDTPFNVSVHRSTADSDTDKTSNATHWVSYVESIDAKFNYPNSVVVGLEIDSAQFGGKIPTRTYRNRWTQIKVPNNYDPITRTYTGIWLGEFKTAWSDNPAWVFYDLVTDKRYGLGDRLGDFGCDKWSLYQIAKYCDQIVPDGFGNQEPRFTCNAYLSEPRDAKSLLDDLASVFRGIAVWDGQMVTALQDAKKDPTATYSNSNVVDGMFAYSGAAQKTIFTAVHVKYNDKNDNYVTKTEYVANDEAIKRYGLNVKQITAFGCTSRGQAARVGKWLIETSIRERQMVSFSVGREGIRHLPFDIIEIADNDYAGDMIGGRVLSVNGNIITVDRAMSNVSSIRYYANGQSKVVSVTAIQDNTITLLNTPVGIEQLGVFSATKTDVKPRLFRALSIKEDDGTYTISAVQHDENKEAVVDQGATFEQDDTATKHKPQVSYGRVSKDGDELVISWEGTNTTQYLIKIYKDGELYNSYTQDTAEIKLKGLSNGEYRAEIRGKSASGELTEAVIKEWSIDYDINGLTATPELFAIALDWTNPTTVINQAKIEIYRSQTADRATASKVATLSYPTDTFTQNGVKLTETHHFWLRLVDDQGNTGDWVTISGQCSSDTSQIVASISGQITQTELAQSLIDSLQNDIDTAKNQAVSSAGLDAASKVAAEGVKRAQALQAEATARANAIQAEANARGQAIAAQDTKQTNALIAKAQQLGTQISEVSGVNGQQAQQLTTITAKQGELTSGLEVERTARIAGDAAETTARQTLASQVGGNKTSITDLQSTKASKTEVSSLARTALQSEWQDAATTAKSQAISAAATDAKAKADAALASAKTDATTKADAAKSAAQTYATAQVNAKSVTDKAYADGLVTAEEQRAINDANAKLALAKTDATTKAAAAESAAKAHAELKIDEIEIGGRNLLLGTSSEAVKSYYEFYGYKNLAPIFEQHGLIEYTISVDLRTPVPGSIRLYSQNGSGTKYNIGWVDCNATTEWRRFTHTFTPTINNNTQETRAMVSFYGIYNTGRFIELRNFKIEKGNKATDWTPAPEDVDAAIDVVSSELTEFKQTTASKDSAQTVVNTQALSRINSAESNITDLQSTKASKTEVSSLARTALQSEWQDAANTAKSQAISAAATDAKAKADAALASAKTDAQTKADAAKSAAQTYATAQVNAKSVTDKAYADGIVSAEEQRAINDANAKLALAKTDATTKANAAESAAKAYADQKVEDVDAAIDVVSSELTEFKQTTASKDSAQTVVNTQALSRINSAETSITSLQSTKASKTEVSSLARTALQSEWQDAANTAKSQAISAAATDAKAKADAALAAAKTDAQTKADAAKAAAQTYATAQVNAKSVTDKAYADGLVTAEEQRAINDANAKFALAKTDAQAKANAAESAAKAYADQKVEDVDAAIDVVSSELTEFKQTTASKDSAQTIVNTQALSRINTAEGKITTLQSTSVTKDKAQSTHTIKTQAIAGGKTAIAGIAIGAMANETTSESQVIVMADNFGVVKDAGDGVVKPMFSLVNNQAAFNGDLIADGTILGKHIKANQTITAPVINGGELNINNRFKVDKFGNGRFEGDVVLKNGQVDTLQIAGNAVTVTSSDYNPNIRRPVLWSSNSIDIRGFICNSITMDINTANANLSISLGFLELNVVSTIFREVVPVNIDIFRGDTLLLSLQVGSVSPGSKILNFTMPPYIDNPPIGKHIYNFELFTTADTRVRGTSLSIMGVKR